MERRLFCHLIRLVPLIALLAGGASLGATALETENPYTSRVDVGMGGRLFRAECSSCHGLNATGSEEGGGPDLTTGRFQHASSDSGLYRVIREGVKGTSMRGLRRVADQSIWQLVTYLRSVSPEPEAVDLAGSPPAGQELFAEHDCARCHTVNGRGGRLGPDLSTIGERRGPGDLRTDLTDPGSEVSPRWWTLRVTRLDGSVVEGLRMSEDTFSLRIMDTEENLRSFSKAAVRTHERLEASSMPSYARSLTADQVDDLVAYLNSLRREREPSK